MKDGTWINDEVLNDSMALLQAHVQQILGMQTATTMTWSVCSQARDLLWRARGHPEGVIPLKCHFFSTFFLQLLC